MNVMERVDAGEDAPFEHLLIEAAGNPSEAEWSRSTYAIDPDERWTEPVENLGE